MKIPKNIHFYLGIGCTFLLSSCNFIGDDNDIAIYSKENGLPVNCRAYVQFAINEYRTGKYSANDTFSALERNCGANGWSWKNVREKL
jgi:hypothetical protein